MLLENLTSVGAYAFKNCNSLSSVAVKSRELSVNSSAFYYAGWGTTTGITATFASTCEYVPSGMFSPPSDYAPKLTKVVINSGTEEIGNSAFDGCASLTSITIPNTVQEIGNFVFKDCTGLKTVSLPSSLIKIGNYAFKGCTALQSITLPRYLTRVGMEAFQGCSLLSSVTVQSEDLSVSSGAFDNAGLGTSTGITATFTSTCRYVPSSIFSSSSSDAPKLTKVVMNSGVEEIGNLAFKYCKYLTSVSIPSSVTSIGQSAFRDCSALKALRIPSSVAAKNIGNYAFIDMASGSVITVSTSDQYSKLNSNSTFINPQRTTVKLEISFRDVSASTPHASDINWLATNNISTGYNDGTFRPYDNVVRQDMSAFLFRMARRWGKVSDSWQASYTQKRAFSDVDTSTPHAREIWWLAYAGISTGFSDGTFRPMGKLTRADMAAFLFRLAKLKGIVSESWQPTAQQRAKFTDVTTSTPHAREIWWLASVGITTGYNDRTFRPMGNLARADMAAFLHRLDSK